MCRMFYNFAVGLKLNRLQQGEPITRDIQGLYEQAVTMDFRKWSDLISNYEW